MVDTNVLVYASTAALRNIRIFPNAPRRSPRSGNRSVRDIPNSVRVLCRGDQRSQGRFAAEGLAAVTAILALPGIRVLASSVEVVGRWIVLASRAPVTGGGIFDVQIVATMQASQVQRIYTYNFADFARFPN